LPYADPEQQKECTRRWNKTPQCISQKKERKLRHKRLIERIKIEIGCEHCGYNENPIGLQFHHLDKSTKSFSIARGLIRNSIDLLKETEKCLVLCATCHVIEEYRLNDNSLY
jgi:hypothetical protein